ncbi:MFS transporter [Neisseria montereyensis]|uniref:MFS transporter n=1 Tax=Neisseria montereyensis TaxID=2973938 RepID=A0ABT2FCY2_9NEIS|nr:MFS transporter [Neisseria montereyensis]MCS4533810.1 MFS transporter [Neisseria montereyensis]
MARENRTQMFPLEWRASSSLAGVYALRMLGMFLVLPVLALYAATLPGADNNKALVGLAMGMYGLTQACLQLPLGMASDRFGRKKVIYVGLIVFAAGSFIAASADSLEILVVGRAIQGAGAISAAVTALLADLTRDEVRTRAMAMIGLSIGLTFSVSLVLAPVLAGWIGVPGLFVLTGILTLISIAVVAWMTPNPETSKLHEDMEAQPSRISEVLKNKQLLSLDFGIFVLHAAQMALFTTLPFALVELGLFKEQHWKIYLPTTIIGLVVMVPLIIIGETRNKLKQVFIGGIACIAVAPIGLFFSLHSVWLITLLLVVYFIGFNVLEASLPSMVSKISPPDLKGTAMGVYNTLQSVGLFTGGAVGGLLFQQYGFNGVFTFCTVLMLLWIIIAFYMPAPKPVKNIAFTIPESQRSHTETLRNELSALSGVESVSFSMDKQTVFIKALQKGFDAAAAEQIISGVNHVIIK